MSTAGWVVLISTLAFLSGLYVTWLMHTRVLMDITVPPAPPPEEAAPLVSVIVPARNEARNIRRCVSALLAQTYPSLEVIVIDDRSTDPTPQVLAEMQASHANGAMLQVVSGQELPPGWAGKPYALTQGVAAAQGEWLCFVDADTFATPDLISAVYSQAVTRQADLFTILTDQELGSFWEKVVLPLVFTALAFGFPADRVNDPRKPDAIANGQFIFVKRAVYEATGGHTAVRDRIDEDKALAETVKRAGYRLIVADGRALAVTRMYTSLPEMWEGWTKNIYVGLRDRLGLLLFGVLVGLIAALALPVWLVGGIIWWWAGGGLPAAVVTLQSLGLWMYLIYWRLKASQAFGISPAYAFTLPLGALVFTAMMLGSAFKVLSGRGVSWRGRTYRP